MPKLPTGWKLEKIGNLCEVGRGSSPRPITDPKYFEGGTIPWIKIADATKSGKYLYETKEHVNEYGASFSRLLPKGSLIVAASGTLGYTQILGVDGCIHDGWLYLTNFKNVDRNFLYYLFILQKEFFYNSAYGAAIQNINTMILRDMEIALPPLPVQRKIADGLSAYDDLIEVNTRRIRILEQMTQSAYREWFGKVDENSLPSGWEIKPFGELISFDINGGWGEEEQTEQFSVPAYVIRGTDIPGGRYGQFDKVPFRYHKQSNFTSRQLINGDIVIEIAGGSKGQPVGRALLIGQQLLNKFDNQVICASFCKLLRPTQSIVSSEYLYLHLREIYENGIIEKYQTQSTGIINFKSTFFLEDNLVIVPDKTMMDKFTEFARPSFEMIETLGMKNANLRRTRDLLLPRLVSGEVSLDRLEIERQRMLSSD